MTPLSFTKYLVSLPSVTSSLLLTEGGEVMSQESAEGLSDSVFQNTITHGRELLKTYQTSMSGANEACLQFSRQVVYLQDLGSHFVILFLSEVDHLPAVRLALNHAKHQVKLLDGSLLLLEEVEEVGEELARYEIKEVIGEGGSAIVFRAWDRRFKRFVALKRFNEESVGRNPADSDYESEVATISQISHPNVVRAYDLDEDENGPFMILELVEGGNLEDLLEKKERLGLNELRPLVLQVFDALSAVHDAGFLHLDIKPSNLMVSDTSYGSLRYTLIDFGRACDSERQQARLDEGAKDSLLGSIHYMAPEQLVKSPLDVRTDLYAAGVLIYESLAGSRPFNGANTMLVIGSHLAGNCTPLHELRPDLSKGICDWVMGLISLKPEERPQSAGEALQAFNEHCVLNFGSDGGSKKDSEVEAEQDSLMLVAS